MAPRLFVLLCDSVKAAWDRLVFSLPLSLKASPLRFMNLSPQVRWRYSPASYQLDWIWLFNAAANCCFGCISNLCAWDVWLPVWSQERRVKRWVIYETHAGPVLLRFSCKQTQASSIGPQIRKWFSRSWRLWLMEKNVPLGKCGCW